MQTVYGIEIHFGVVKGFDGEVAAGCGDHGQRLQEDARANVCERDIKRFGRQPEVEVIVNPCLCLADGPELHRLGVMGRGIPSDVLDDIEPQSISVLKHAANL
jgi:hypothetical protein